MIMTHPVIQRWFPHPLVSVIVIITWLLLARSLALDSWLFAIIIGTIIPRLVQRFIDHTPNIQWLPAIKLFLIVLWDIVLCNINVAKLVLGPSKNIHPKWFRVPLETEYEEVNALLAMIITTTPGTVSAGIDLDRGDILVHALSIDDVNAEIASIKSRYEQPLIQIFSAKTGAQA